MLTEYHTANHANALVNLMYFKGDSSVGYHIHTVRGNNPTHLLDHAIDFRIARVTSGIMTFQLLDEAPASCTAHSFRWNEFIAHIRVMQKAIRSKIWRLHRRKLHAFMQPHRSFPTGGGHARRPWQGAARPPPGCALTV